MAGKEYQMAFSIGAKLQGQFGAAFKSAQSSITSLQNTIASLNKQQGDIAAYQKQQKAVEQTRAKLQMLQQQYANLKSSMGENGEASVELKNKMLQKELQIQRTTERLESQEAQLSSTGNALKEAGVDTDNLAAASASLAGEIDNLKAEQEELASSTEESGQAMSGAADAMMEFVSAAGIAVVLKEAYDALKACSEEAIAFEESMAAVRRTVGGDDAFLSDLASGFKQLSTEIPISTAELTEIAATAGQLGIAQNDVESFTTVMAMLATTTDLTASEAATMLAQFANITGIKEYDRLGSVIAELGDATATTASKVVEMSQGMAASASQAGMTSTDIMAIAAALGSLGIEAQAGSTSMSQLISTLYKATETGENLEQFASVAGMSAEQFRRAWADNAVGAMDAFIQGLNDVERNGKSAIVILEELGINNVRQTKAILGLASAGDLLSRTINQADSAWNNNTALTEKASIMYETTQAKLTMMNNAFSNMKIAIGEAFTPVISSAATALTNIMRPVTEYLEKNPAVIKAVAAAAAVIGTVVGALAAYTVAAKIAAAASALLSASIPGLNIILAVTAGIAALAAGIVLLSSAFEDGKQTMEELDTEFDGLNEQIQEQQEIIDLVDKYKRLQKELHNTSDTVENLSFEDVDITLTAEADATLVPDDFMVEGAKGITLTAEQEAVLLASGFLDPDDKGITITAGQIADLLESGFLSPDDEGITLSAEQMANLLEEGFLKPDDKGITLTAQQTKNLLESGFLNPDDKGITLTAAQTKDLLESGFLDPDDEGILLAAQQTADLLESGFLNPDDEGITLTAEQMADLVEAGFLSPDDEGITLTAEQTASLLEAGFLNPDDKGITLTAEQTANLLESGFLNPDDTGITLTAQQTATLLESGFLNPDDKGITLSAEQTADLLKSGFLNPNDTGITLTAKQTANLVEAGFLSPEDKGITLTAEQTANLLESGFLSAEDKGIILEAEQTANLLESGFLNPDDDGITLTAEQTANLVKAGFLSPDDTGITLTAEQTANLLASGFLSNEDEGITLTAEQTANLYEAGFLNPEDEGITLTAEQIATLQAAGFMKPDDKGITLTAEQQKTLIEAGFLKPDDAGIVLTATATQNLTAEDFVANPSLAFTATIDNLPELQQAVTNLSTKAAGLKSEFSIASSDLSTMQQRYGELEARLKYAGNAADKSAIQAEMETLSGLIGEQEGKVKELEEAYKEASAEYQTAATAAQNLKDKESELAEVKSQIKDATKGMIPEIALETMSYEEQLGVLQAIAEARKAELQAKTVENIREQAAAYKQSYQEAKRVGTWYQYNVKTLQIMGKYMEDGPEMLPVHLRNAYNELEKLYSLNGKQNGDMLNLDVNSSEIREIETLMYLMTGKQINFSQYSTLNDVWSNVSKAINNSSGSLETMLLVQGEIANLALQYGEDYDAANASMKMFTDNLVQGITEGGMTLEMTEALLKEVFGTDEAGLEIIASIMAQVRSEIEGAADAAEGMKEGMEGTTDSSSDVEQAISNITAQMEELGNAYHEVYDAAYKSMDGQFKLFEEVGEIAPASVDDMIAALQSQQAYMQEYAANLKAAAEMGVSDGLLAQLSDGSKESAAYLAAIVKDGSGKIDDLNTAFAGVEEGKSQFADTVAEMETDFSAKMAELQSSLETTISEMNMSSEAASAAKETMTSFANAATAMEPTIAAAFKKAADAAKKELYIKFKPGAGGFEAYASGTKNAERGFAVVGEEGPEIVWMNGGETVMSAQETAAFAENRSLDAEPVSAVSASGAGEAGVYHIEIRPEYTISGIADTDELRGVLSEQTDNLRGMIEDVLADIEADRERSVYA